MGCCLQLQAFNNITKHGQQQKQIKQTAQNQPPLTTQRIALTILDQKVHLPKENHIDLLQNQCRGDNKIDLVSDPSRINQYISHIQKSDCLEIFDNANAKLDKADTLSEANTDTTYYKNFIKSSTIISESRSITRQFSLDKRIDQKNGKDNFLNSTDEIENQPFFQVIIFDELQKIEQAKLKQEFYVVIQKKMYVRKYKNTVLDINSPAGQIILRASQERIKQSIFFNEGIPIENIRLLKENSFIYESNYEIQMSLKLRCLHCDRIKKFIFRICLINIETIICECRNNHFEMVKVKSKHNVPIWMNNTKINDKKKIMFEQKGLIRILGCVQCWKFENCTVKNCGCWLCSDCEFYQLNKQQCKLHR